MTGSECLICRKHRGEGPLVGPVVLCDDLLVVSHRADGALGHLFVEPRRHVPQLDGLTDAEAEALGRTTARLARALRAELDLAFVFTMVIGMGVAHVHQHVVARHAGTPDGLPWWEEWTGAPRGEIAHLCGRLRPNLLVP